MEFIRQLTASRRVLAFYAVSCILLYFVAYYFPFGKGDSDLVNQIIKQGGHYELMNKKYYAVYSIYNFTFASALIQILILIPIVIINVKSWRDNVVPGIYAGAVLFSLSFVNIGSIIFYSVVRMFTIIPYASLYFIVLFFVFIIAFVAYLIPKFDQEENSNKELFQKIEARLAKFGFPYYKAVYLISFALFVILNILGKIQEGQHWKSPSLLNYLSAAIGTFGVIYLAFGRHYKLKKLDELQRLKQLEAGHYIFNGLTTIIIIAIFVSVSLSIKVQITDLVIPISVIIILAVAAIEKKYE